MQPEANGGNAGMELELSRFDLLAGMNKSTALRALLVSPKSNVSIPAECRRQKPWSSAMVTTRCSQRRMSGIGILHVQIDGKTSHKLVRNAA